MPFLGELIIAYYQSAYIHCQVRITCQKVRHGKDEYTCCQHHYRVQALVVEPHPLHQLHYAFTESESYHAAHHQLYHHRPDYSCRTHLACTDQHAYQRYRQYIRHRVVGSRFQLQQRTQIMLQPQAIRP